MKSPAVLGTLARLAYVALMLAIVSAGTLNMVVKVVDDTRLGGVEWGAKPPRLTLSAFKDETFQRDATAWLEQHWGLRGFAIRTDNTLVLRVFGEMRTATVVLGTRGSLIGESDLAYVNRVDDPAAAAPVAKTIARIQARMRKRQAGPILFLPVVMPAKTSMPAYREEIPAEWQRRGAFAVSDERTYRAFVDALKAEGVTFVDARAMLERQSNVFARTGHHWRISKACAVVDAIVDAARLDIPELGQEHVDCSAHVDPNADVGADDYDLFRLQNVWGPPPPGTNVEVLDGKRAEEGSPLRVPTLFEGSSFVTTLGRVSNALGVLPGYFYYYDSTVIETSTFEEKRKVVPFTEQWRRDTLGRRLIVFGLLETFLPLDQQRFLEELDKELDLEDTR